MLFGQLFLTNDSFLKKDIYCPDTGQDLGSFLQGLSTAKENRPILWNTEAKLKKKKLHLPTMEHHLFLEDFSPLHCVLLHPNSSRSRMKGSCQTSHYQTPQSGKSLSIPRDVPGKLVDNPVSNQQRNCLGGGGTHH